jgi:hypothetical protein
MRLTKLPSTSARSLFVVDWNCSQVKAASECFRAIGRQVPAPVVGGQQLQRLIHEDAALLAGREFAAVPVQPVEGLERIDRLPRLARAEMVAGKLTVWKATLSLPMNWT